VALLSGDPGATSLSLARLEPSLNPDSRALTAWTGALSGARCRPGTPVRLSVRIESPPGLLVSRGAVVLSDDGPAVYTTSDGVAHRHAVEILAGDAQTVCLRSETLADGDRVVILGGHELEDGSPVRVEGGP